MNVLILMDLFGPRSGHIGQIMNVLILMDLFGRARPIRGTALSVPATVPATDAT